MAGGPLSDACQLARRLAAGVISPADLAAAYMERIAVGDGETQAWIARDRVALDAELARIAAIPSELRGPLWGLPVAVKDVFDTADLPTAYGSGIYAGHRPAADAAAVARLRSAGAVILGKTVSTEFAYWAPGPTRNPRDTTRSPGGSSSGSAAAVAAGMVPLALGTQTAASTIRPAAYCGIVGFKPTRWRIPRAGVKALAGSLDAVGLFARSVADAALLASALSGRDLAAPAAPPARFRLARWAAWSRAEPAQRAAVERALDRLAVAGAAVERPAALELLDALGEAQTLLMACEAVRELAHERRIHGDRLSPSLHELFEIGERVGETEEAAARALATHPANLAALIPPGTVLVAPSALGEAPRFEDGTGDPVMSRGFTLLDLPSLSLPCGTGPGGLPLGLQLAARPGEDSALLGAASWVEAVLAQGG